MSGKIELYNEAGELKLLSNSDFNLPISTKTANHTALVTDLVLLCDATSGVLTISLPAAAPNIGVHYHIKKIDSSGNAVTIDGDGSETIDRDATVDITTQDESLHVVCDGNDWFIV